MEKINQKKKPQEFVGKVIGNKADKTISVLIYRSIQQKKYGKYVRKKSVFKAHDVKNEARVGDTVRIFETRPLSKTKRWRLGGVLEKRESEK